MSQRRESVSFSTFVGFGCILYLIGCSIDSILHQWAFRLQESKIIAIDETNYRNQNCFYLSWRTDLELKTLREIVIHNSGKKLNAVNESKTVRNRSDICKRFVTLERSRGRLGNQMFQVAAVLGVAYTYDIVPVLPKQCLLAKYIDLPNAIDKREILDNTVRFKCKATAYFSVCPAGVLDSKSNITMYGCFQSWLFFKKTQDIIRKVLTLKIIHRMKADQFMRTSTKSGYKKVCIHIRRGDFLNERQLRRGFSVANLAYIKRAKKIFLKKYSKVQFVVLSNDKEWCKMHIKGDVISNFTESGDDMALMALCDDVVVTSGTFGWWGAWLSGGTTVYFKGYPRPGSPLDRRFNRTEYYPPHWIGI
ncbi:galactoside alpha-(1,2)-fucosyltransferase 1-like [Mercenaria mercenaria]|uniref:galactoside alpha-(1,2)-fucosyltransferase 1-like n=1 Tax=Mercenaria mercenaria TaxID=6596 RepID=UPI00234EB85B|nr:galactoside alpha-(1,2)-fucosyltransferase 1-like [Mercenaria mercenaria]